MGQPVHALFSIQRLLELSERPVSWVHGSILGFGQPTDPLDVRVNVQTKEKIDLRSDLFKFIFPMGLPPNRNVIEMDPVATQIRLTLVSQTFLKFATALADLLFIEFQD